MLTLRKFPPLGGVQAGGTCPIMKVVEFEDWLDRLGDDVSRWPESQRQAAQALLEGSAEARTLLEEALVLRRALAAPKVRAPPGLADRIVAQAARSPPASKPVQKTAFWVLALQFLSKYFQPVPTVGLALCFFLGILVGVFTPSKDADLDLVDLPTYVAYVVDMAHNAD
jgi:hypothetical protein